MKALTLTQPWASLVASGAKTIETRSWSTRYRGALAIHAAARWSRADINYAFEVEEGRPPARLGDLDILRDWPMPLGKVIAVVILSEVLPVEALEPDIADVITAREFAYGDYSPGRFAWILDNVRPIEPPVPAKGHLGLWDWRTDVPIVCIRRAGE
jgi:hypothetical protein